MRKKKNPNAVALGKLGGLRGGKIRFENEDVGYEIEEKGEVHDWLKTEDATGSNIVAYESATLFFYWPSGGADHYPLTRRAIEHRSSMRSCSALARTRGTSAKYWFISDDDFSREWEAAMVSGRARKKEVEREVERVLPLVFHSQGGHVRIYGLGCIQHARDLSCQLVEPVLFPFRGRGVQPLTQ